MKKLILTGEPTPDPLRRQLEQLWSAHCFDRYGLTEAGSIAGECLGHPGGMHLLENEFIAEVIHPQTAQAVAEGQEGELVLTTLGRLASPIIRYRTGDHARLVHNHHCACGRTEALLIGGIARRAG